MSVQSDLVPMKVVPTGSRIECRLSRISGWVGNEPILVSWTIWGKKADIVNNETIAQVRGAIAGYALDQAGCDDPSCLHDSHRIGANTLVTVLFTLFR